MGPEWVSHLVLLGEVDGEYRLLYLSHTMWALVTALVLDIKKAVPVDLGTTKPLTPVITVNLKKTYHKKFQKVTRCQKITGTKSQVKIHRIKFKNKDTGKFYENFVKTNGRN
jgi:hypothetical protein